MAHRVVVFSFLSTIWVIGLAGHVCGQGPSIEDRNYLFRIDKPNRSWEFLDREMAATYDVTGVAGIFDPRRRRFGLVTAAPALADTPLGHLEAFLALAPKGAINPLATAEATVLGRPGAIMVFDGISIQGAVVGEMRVILRDGYAISFTAAGDKSTVRKDGSTFVPVFRCFSLLSGTVKAPRPKNAIDDVHGQGWHVKDGTYSNAVFGFDVYPVGSWKFVLRDELDQRGSDAEIGVEKKFENGAMTWTLAATTVGAQAEAVAAERIAAKIPERARRAARAKLLILVIGAPKGLSLVRFPSPQSNQIETAYVAFAREGVVYDLQMWYPAAQRSRVAQIVTDVTRSLRFVTPKQFEAARGRQASLPDRQTEVAGHTTLRKGIYTDYENGVTWTSSGRPWRIRIGAGARKITRRDDADVVLHEPTTGVVAVLAVASVKENETPAEAHTAAVAAAGLGAGSGKPKSTSIAGVPALRSSVQTPEGRRVAVTTLRREKIAIQVVTIAIPEIVDDDSSVLEEIDRGLAFRSDLEAFEDDATGCVDHVNGFRYRYPIKDMKFERKVVDDGGPVSSTLSYATSKRAVSLTVRPIDESLGADPVTATATKLARTIKVAGVALPQQVKTTVAGRPAQALIWRNRQLERHVYVFESSGVSYILTVTLLVNSKESFDSYVSALSLID